MFSNQKNFFKSKWFYTVTALALLAFGIWVNYDEKSQSANTPVRSEQESQTQARPEGYGAVRDNPEKNGDNPADEPDESTEPADEQQQSYYLIQEIEGVVKVFYCDENGQESLHQITSIPFSLLSGEDQKMLTEGVRVDTESELAGFLENFDS